MSFFDLIYSLYCPAELQNNQVMAAKCFDDARNFLFDFLNSYDWNNQSSIISIRNKIFWFCKKYLEADALQNTTE